MEAVAVTRKDSIECLENHSCSCQVPCQSHHTAGGNRKLGKETHRELIEEGVLNEDEMNEEVIKEKVIGRTMDKVFEQARNHIKEKDLLWVDRGMRFAVKWYFEKMLKQYNQQQQLLIIKRMTNSWINESVR
jgi:hypothetical protein